MCWSVFEKTIEYKIYSPNLFICRNAYLKIRTIQKDPSWKVSEEKITK